MATIRTSGDIFALFGTNLADNNAGNISAADVRGPLEDLMVSFMDIVGSGDMDVKNPLYGDIRIKQISGVGGTLLPESGIIFPNSPVNSSSRQVEPFLGVGGLLHNSLGGLGLGNPHVQYVHVDGTNVMTGNFQAGNNWIGASGNNNMGFKFAPNGAGTEDILTSGDLVFDDGSRVSTGLGQAKAWLQFDASGVGTSVPVVHGWHNISGVTKTGVGQFNITFASGTFTNNEYVAIGTSNGTTGSGSPVDLDVNTVACVVREGDDGSALRTCSFVIQNDAGEYVDGKINDFVVYGYEPNATSGTLPTIVGF
jgi:hypothetical protein